MKKSSRFHGFWKYVYPSAMIFIAASTMKMVTNTTSSVSSVFFSCESGATLAGESTARKHEDTTMMRIIALSKCLSSRTNADSRATSADAPSSAFPSVSCAPCCRSRRRERRRRRAAPPCVDAPPASAAPSSAIRRHVVGSSSSSLSNPEKLSSRMAKNKFNTM